MGQFNLELKLFINSWKRKKNAEGAFRVYQFPSRKGVDTSGPVQGLLLYMGINKRENARHIQFQKEREADTG